MLGTLLIVAGSILAIGSIVSAFYLVSLGCSMGGASGCDRDGIDLLAELMASNDGLLFWAAWVIGLFLIWGGMRLRARNGR